jgi:hypothetical protein
MSVRVASSRHGDAYLAVLSGVLAGYAFLGKGFAYIGIPPFYIGDLTFLAGLAVLIRTHCLLGVLAARPTLLLAAMMSWVLIRTLPFIDTYGIDALRDSVVIMYGGFALILIALLLEDSRRANTLARYYDKFLSFYVPAIPFLFAISWSMRAYLPTVLGSNIPVLQVEPGEVATHLTGAVVFVLVGLRKPNRVWLVLLLVGLLMTGALSRGPMLAEVLPITFAVLVLGRWRELALTLIAGIALFWIAYAVEPLFFDYVPAESSEERSISTRQVIDNVASLFGQGSGQTEGTKEWRREWWNDIIDYTFNGPYFWTGRGFGLNIAIADGYSNWTPKSGRPPLRSPHNVSMTLLARSGVPGVTLWLGVLASWFATMMRTMWVARRRGEPEWTGLFLFVGCYVASILINASTDPALEAPMQGIWFWCLFGIGVGLVMIFRARRPARLLVVASDTEFARPR